MQYDKPLKNYLQNISVFFGIVNSTSEFYKWMKLFTFVFRQDKRKFWLKKLV